MFSLFGLLCDIFAFIWNSIGKIVVALLYVFWILVQAICTIIVISILIYSLGVGAERLGYSEFGNKLKNLSQTEFSFEETNIVDSIKERKQKKDYSVSFRYSLSVHNPFYKDEVAKIEKEQK
mgnify:CR=1 FL=1